MATTRQKPQPRVTLAGSERKPMEGWKAVGPVDSNERVEVSVYLHAPARDDMEKELADCVMEKRSPMSREEYATRYGASKEDIAQIEKFASDHKLTVVEKHIARRMVVLAGTTDAISAAFGTQLQMREYQGNTYRTRVGSLTIPKDIASIVSGVFGIDNRPQARHYVQHPRDKAMSTAVAFTPPQVAKLYNFPPGDGSDQTIAIIELGGNLNRGDLSTYFEQLGVAVPEIVNVVVGTEKNIDRNSDSDGEVALDIEVVGSIVPKAKMVVYFAENTTQGFVDAITNAIHDTVNAPSVISISWGMRENGWTTQGIQNMNRAFKVAALLGVTVCAAAGDNGPQDGDPKLLQVDYPASDPYVLGCGGTSLQGSNGTITREEVWNNDPTTSATGGGFSKVFDMPQWQKDAHVSPPPNFQGRVGRGVPDVSGNADPRTGYNVRFGGQSTVLGGTSAVAPLWAALIALCNQKRGKPAGYINRTLYRLDPQSGGFHDIVIGSIGKFPAKRGWDACTGLGSPNGAKLVDLLAKM